MKRRSFVKHIAHSLAAPGILGTMGFKLPGSHSLSSLLRMAIDTDRVLVLIFMDGGNDGLNTVVPLDQLSALNKVRPHVVLPENSLLQLDRSEVGLHPALEGLKSLYDEDRLQIIQNVGYPDQNYSHFRSADIWMSGSDADELVNSGWTGRFLNETFPGYPDSYPNEDMTDPLAVEIGYGSSLLFQGPQSAMSMVISDPDFFYDLVDGEEQPAPDTLAGDKLRYVRLIARQSQSYGQTVKQAADKVKRQVDFPLTFIAQQLKIVSQLIAGGLKTPLYMVRYGGFDTHDAQVEESDHTAGEHAQLLQELNDAVMAFMKDLEMQGTDDRVVGMTFSEFGRRIVSNASLGTDHGAAAPLFCFGNAVMGGVTGENPQISSSATYDDNLDWKVDFRQVYASLLEQWLGTDSSVISNVLNGDFESVEIIGERTETLSAASQVSRDLLVYPNPMKDHVTIRMSPTFEKVSVDLIDMAGRKVLNIYKGQIQSPKDLIWNASQVPAGRYFVSVRGPQTSRMFSVIKL